MIRELSYYDKIICSFSGGKDSTALILFMLENGAKPEQLEIWHQSIDGKMDTHVNFFDWPSTDGYVKNFAKTFNLFLSYQWREYGFYGELFKKDSLTQAVTFERKGQINRLPSSTAANPSTRLKWPAKSASLMTRWCTAYLKIDVAARALNNIPEFHDKRILFLTGERREESTARSKYQEAELHRTNSKKKLVHHWRPVIDWKEQEIWDIIQRNKVAPHPVYYLGFPRLSCRSCIFYSRNHWAPLNDIQPEIINRIHEIEEFLNFTLDNKLTINEIVRLGKSSITEANMKYIPEAINEFTGQILTDNWKLPDGAFGKGGGSI